MISIPNKEHAPQESMEVWILHKKDSLILLPPLNIPQLFMLINCIFFSLPICGRQVKNLVPFFVHHLECMFHFHDINIESWANNQHWHHLAQWYIHLDLPFWKNLLFFQYLDHAKLGLIFNILNSFVKRPCQMFHECLGCTNNLTKGR